MTLSSVGTIIIAAVVLLLVFKILSGLLRLGIAIAIIGFIGYWGYITFFLK